MSIQKYGNLFNSNASIEVDYNGTNYTFQIGNKEKIIGIKVFNEELKKQGNITTDTDYTIEQLINRESNLNFDYQKSPSKAKVKKDSIEQYGDLGVNQDLIKAHHDGINYTFQIEGKTKINGLDDFSRELNKQGLNNKTFNLENINRRMHKSFEEQIESFVNESTTFTNENRITEDSNFVSKNNSNQVTYSSNLFNKNYNADTNFIYISFLSGIVLFATLSWFLVKKFFIKKEK